MIDFVSPLGQPPLNSFSPTQEVRTADVLPTGVWEIELGAQESRGFAIAPFGVRTGVVPGLELDLGYPGAGRQVLSAAYGVIPGMLALSAGWTPSLLAGANQLEVASQIQLETPWGTPRISPRLDWLSSYGNRSSIPAQWFPRLDLGYDYPLTSDLSAGADVDLDAAAPAQTAVALGARARLFDNLGGSLYASYEPGTRSLSGGVILADRFYGR